MFFYIIPVALLIIIPIILYLKRSLKLEMRFICIFILFIVVLRILCFAWGILIIYDNPPPKEVYNIYQKMGIFQLFVAPDVNIFESLLCKRRDDMYSLLIKNRKSIINEISSKNNITSGTIDSIIDIYSGKSIRWKKSDSGIYSYSIGPDNFDNNIEITYDPTNGLYSAGDIVFKLE